MEYEGGFRLACDPKSLLYLFGMSLDYSDALIGGGFNFRYALAVTSQRLGLASCCVGPASVLRTTVNLRQGHAGVASSIRRRAPKAQGSFCSSASHVTSPTPAHSSTLKITV